MTTNEVKDIDKKVKNKRTTFHENKNIKNNKIMTYKRCLNSRNTRMIVKCITKVEQTEK